MKLPRSAALFGLCAITACSFRLHPAIGDGGGDGSGADGSNAAVRYRKPITVTASSPTPLADFVVSVVTSDPALAMHARSDGSDLAFTAGDGTPLAFELVRYATGDLEAWVRLPALSSSADLYLTYGGPPATSPGPAWAPATFAGVWHLAESQPPWRDSAGAHPVMPPGASATPVSVTGIAGAGLQFDGVDDATSAGDPADGSLDFGTSSFSLEAWVNVAQSATAYDAVIDKGNVGASPGFMLSLGTGSWYADIADGASAVAAAPFGSEATLLGRWHQLVGVIDRNAQSASAYLDGAFVTEVSISGQGSIDSAEDFTIGTTNGSWRFEGVADEIRVYKGALSADWIAASYRNLAQRAQFVTVGAEETY